MNPIHRTDPVGLFFNQESSMLNQPSCPLLALSGHSFLHRGCLLSAVKRTCVGALQMSAYDPKRTSVVPLTGPSHHRVASSLGGSGSARGQPEGKTAVLRSFNKWAAPLATRKRGPPRRRLVVAAARNNRTRVFL
jgi:hypothetical protein